jgi:hypothetical protein
MIRQDKKVASSIFLILANRFKPCNKGLSKRNKERNKMKDLKKTRDTSTESRDRKRDKDGWKANVKAARNAKSKRREFETGGK